MIRWSSEEWPLDRFLSTTKAHFNPKDAGPDEIASLAEDYRTFGVGRAFAARDDGLLLDGHQSVLAFERLLRGEHIVAGKVADWPTKPKTVAMRIAHGMSDTVARAFIAAVNHNRVDPDPRKYAALLLDLTERVKSASDDDRVFYQQAVDAIGHAPDELAELLGQASDVGGGGGGARSQGNPKATFEFSAAWVRDAVKRKVAEHAGEGGTPHGNVLAKLLGIKEPRKKR